MIINLIILLIVPFLMAGVIRKQKLSGAEERVLPYFSLCMILLNF